MRETISTDTHNHSGACGLSYDDLDCLPVPYLALIVREIPLKTAALASAFEPPEFVARIRAAVGEDQRLALDALASAKQDVSGIGAAQDAILQAMCDVLMSGRFRLD